VGPYLKRQHSLHLSFFQLINDISKLFQFISKNSTIKLVSYIFICYHCSKLDLILKCWKKFIYVTYKLGYPALLEIFIVSSVSLSLCFYVSLSLCVSVSPLYLSISTKPNLTLNLSSCLPADLPACPSLSLPL